MDIAVAPTSSVPEWVRALYDRAPIGVVVCDLEERIVYLNAFQEWNSGVRAEQVVGRLFPEVFRRAIDQIRPQYDALRDTGQPYSITLRHYNRASDGRRMSLTVSAYRTAGYYFFFPMVQEDLFEVEQHVEELRH